MLAAFDFAASQHTSPTTLVDGLRMAARGELHESQARRVSSPPLALSRRRAVEGRDRRLLVRLRDRVRRFIIESLIAGTAQHPAILQQLSIEFDRAAKRAKAI